MTQEKGATMLLVLLALVANSVTNSYAHVGLTHHFFLNRFEGNWKPLAWLENGVRTHDVFYTSNMDVVYEITNTGFRIKLNASCKSQGDKVSTFYFYPKLRFSGNTVKILMPEAIDDSTTIVMQGKERTTLSVVNEMIQLKNPKAEQARDGIEMTLAAMGLLLEFYGQVNLENGEMVLLGSFPGMDGAAQGMVLKRY